MMIQWISALFLVFVAAGCNLYTELDRSSGDPTDGGTNNSMSDSGEGDMGTATDASFMGDERWRSMEIAIGSDATSPIAWRVQIPDGIAAEGFGPGGAWLRVYDEEGNPVARQIESWTTGAHVFWLNVDPGPGSTRRFWLGYGVESEEPSPNATEVWNAGAYAAVWGFASDPGADVAAWIGNAVAQPIEGTGTFAIGGGRVALCVKGRDGWTVPANPDFGIPRASQGKTFELIYRADPGGSVGRILSTEDSCNGIAISIADALVLGRVNAGTDCDAGFPEGQAVADRSPADTTAFTHATLTVEPIQQGYDLSLYMNGNRSGTDRVITNQNEVEAHQLSIAAFADEEVSACIDQVHVIDGVRTASDVEAAFRGSFGEDVNFGSVQASPEFATP